MSVWSAIGRAFSSSNTQLKTTVLVKPEEKTTSIIDPRSINVVKSNTIIGAINYSNTSKYLKLMKWLESNEVKLAKALLADDETLSSHELALYPSFKGGSIAYGPGCFSTATKDDPVYVLGDVHGDFDSFVAMLDAILDLSKKKGEASPVVYLLGDVIDREKKGCMHVTALIIAILQRALPEEFNEFNGIRLGIVKGDHDVALHYDDATKHFSAEVSPADYCDWLNERAKTLGEDGTLIGRAWIRLMDECPAAAFLEGSGTLLVHGGIPRSDIQDAVKAGTPYIMQAPEIATDFEWCRMVDAKNKLLNRGTKTSEIGFQEFDSFNEVFFNRHIKNFIFGHQHPATGFQRYDKNFTGYDVMCLASYRNDTVLGGPTIPHFCRVDTKEINVYSMKPTMYVVSLEENSAEAKKVVSLKTIETPTVKPSVNPNQTGYQPAGGWGTK